MDDKNIETIYAESSLDWRAWLKNNHQSKQSVWLIQYKQKSAKPSLSWSDAVDEALCFGWIDSTRRSIDEESFMQLFTRRKPKSAWSKINKQKVERLIDEGKIEEAGLKSIEVAKKNGSWTLLDEVEELVVPDDLKKAFKTHPVSETYFLQLSKSMKKMFLHSLAIAKRVETREKRINEFVLLAANSI